VHFPPFSLRRRVAGNALNLHIFLRDERRLEAEETIPTHLIGAKGAREESDVLHHGYRRDDGNSGSVLHAFAS
jgi:hypothetical protein